MYQILRNKHQRMTKKAIEQIKQAIILTLKAGPEDGMTTTMVGKELGLDAIGGENHRGHVQRAFLMNLWQAKKIERPNRGRKWRYPKGKK